MCLGRIRRQNLQALNPGGHLVEGGLDVGQYGEDWTLVDTNSRPHGGDTNASVGELIEVSISAGTGTVLLGCAFL